MKRARVSYRRGWEVLCPTLHDVQRLVTLQAALDLFIHGMNDEGVTMMATRPMRWVGLPSTPALSRAVLEFMLRRSCTLREFIVAVLQPSLRVALEFSTLFPPASPPMKNLAPAAVNHIGGARGCSVLINQPVASFTRRQVWCLLSNMFFCTFPSRGKAVIVNSDVHCDEGDADCVDVRLLPTTDYTKILSAPADTNDVAVTKLLLLFDFLMEAHRWTPQQSAEVEMTALRLRASPALAQALLPKVWCAVPTAVASSSMSATFGLLLPVVLHPLGESIDDQQDMIRLDFANRWIGGGALGDGAVQEEITFAQCPALNILRWYQSRMEHTESIVVTDYRQYGCVQPGTYGSVLRYGEAFSPPRICRGALLAVDALDFRCNTVVEYSRAAVYREMMKLVGGLASPALRAVSAVAGGNWGCGVFGGDYELKFLLQWAACGISGKELHYFPFDNNAFAHFVPQVTERLERGCTPGLTTSNLISFLYYLEDASDGDDDTAAPDGKTTEKGEFGFVWSSFVQYFHLLNEAESGTAELHE